MATKLTTIASGAMVLLCLLLAGCSKREGVNARTLASNGFEKDLQRVVLPSVAKFNGGVVDPVSLFGWLEGEAIKHDPSDEKVRFVILISSNDVPPASIGVQAKFEYKGNSPKDSIMLPDAIKYYAGICGLHFTFTKNQVKIQSVEDSSQSGH